MSDENKYMESDDLMRSVLSQGQEEVPAHIWEGISSELDRIDAAKGRKTVMLWFRRTAIAVAAAAVLAIGIFTDWNTRQAITDAADITLIAVAEPAQINIEAELTEPLSVVERRIPYLADATEEVQESMTMAEKLIVTEDTTIYDEPAELKSPVHENIEQPQEKWPDIWEEEAEEESRRGRTSIFLSGIAGTNSVQTSGVNMLRRPSMSISRPKTGVEQKSSESTYGLPVSLGAGMNIGLNERWSLGFGVNYTLLTRKFFGTYTLVNNEGNIEESISSDIRNVQQYIGIPVNIFYNIVSNDYLNFYTYAGGAVERCIADKYDVLNTAYIYKGNVKGVQLSANLGIGVEFLLGKHLGLYVDPSIRYYFDCNQPKSIRTAQPFMLGFEAGLRINL